MTRGPLDIPVIEELSRFVTARVVCRRDTVNVALYLQRYPTNAQNSAVAEVLRRQYASHLATYALRVDDWHGSQESTKRERIITELDVGYENGQPQDVANRAAQLLAAWARMIKERPLDGMEQRVAEAMAARTDQP